jgi:phospholipase/carboxylesterase
MPGQPSPFRVRASRSPLDSRPLRHPLPRWPGVAGVFVPQGYEPGYRYPLLVWLPEASGGFDLGTVMARTSLRNFVAVEPAAAADTTASVWRAIDRVSRHVAIHPRRVYLVGTGAGGTEAFRIACRHPEAFAGVVSLGGSFPLDEGLFGRLAAVRQMPMLLCCHRDADAHEAAILDRTLRLFHAAGTQLAVRIYPRPDALAREVLADVNRWVMDEVCHAPDATAEPCVH